MNASPPSFIAVTGPAGVSLDWLPCAVQHDGPVDTSKYWLPQEVSGQQTAAGSGNAQEVSLRGRHLKGLKIRLPEQYVGALLQPRVDDDDVVHWVTRARFHDLTHWNHDSCPAPTDTSRRVLDWLDTAVKVLQQRLGSEVVVLPTTSSTHDNVSQVHKQLTPEQVQAKAKQLAEVQQAK